MLAFNWELNILTSIARMFASVHINNQSPFYLAFLPPPPPPLPLDLPVLLLVTCSGDDRIPLHYVYMV
ncbi:hypothetical protein HanPI659440_Chr03g0099661 [Helianthus annuus]|nr:hypothetical protein HanPI659440_Chr03g0099661 [Helianthus annuus]